MRRLSTFIGGAILVGILICGFIGYFVTSSPADSQQWFDGFGRPLSESPWFVRAVFGQERLWAGWFWFIADMVLFWGGIAIAFAFIKLGERK